MAKKVNVYNGGLSSADGAQVGDLVIDKGVIFQMEEDGLKKLSDIQSTWANVQKEMVAEAKKEADAVKAEQKKEVAAEKESRAHNG